MKTWAALEVTRPGDLCDEHWLHVKYHIISMTAVAYADISITSPESDGFFCKGYVREVSLYTGVLILRVCLSLMWWYVSFCDWETRFGLSVTAKTRSSESSQVL